MKPEPPIRDVYAPEKDPVALAQDRSVNNPKNEPTGHFTGRCKHCGSTDLWEDNLAYGCNNCHALLATN